MFVMVWFYRNQQLVYGCVWFGGYEWMVYWQCWVMFGECVVWYELNVVGYGLVLLGCYNYCFVFLSIGVIMFCQIINIEKVFVVIGFYLQVVCVGNIVYFFGQILLDLVIGDIVGVGDVEVQVCCVFDNFKVVVEVVGGLLDQVVCFGLYLIDLGEFVKVNVVMQDYFQVLFLVCFIIEVFGLLKGVNFEVDVVMVID